MSKFKVGDVVKRKDGNWFSNRKLTATVGEWTFNFEPRDRVSLVETGTYIGEENIELVSSSSPVRETTVVKKEIIPGTYGDVEISSSGVIYMSPICGTGKNRLAEAIKTLQTIHDAME